MKFMSRLDDLLIAALDHALGVLDRKALTLAELYRLYDMSENTAALRRSAEKLNELKFISLEAEADTQRFFTRALSTTPLGHEYVEMEFGDNLATFLEQNGLGFQQDAALGYDSPDEQPTEGPLIDSTSWTGLVSDADLTEEKRSKLILALKKVDMDLSDASLSNAEKAQARAYVAASIILSEMPEPPVDLIWEMITRAATVAGIASLFVAVIALLKV